MSSIPAVSRGESRLRFVFYGVTIFIVVFALTIVLVSLFRSSDADNILRFCFVAQPGAEVGAALFGEITLNTASNTVSYYMQDNGAISAIQSLVIRGPQPPGSGVGPVLFSLCGAPNLVQVCDILTIPGVVQASGLTQLQPGALDPSPVILQIRQHPELYYLEVLTASFPATPGGLRAQLTSSCGFP